MMSGRRAIARIDLRTIFDPSNRKKGGSDEPPLRDHALV
jgi:hypothetical protein